jgi:nuclear pore complex protein Nup205
MSLHWSLEPFRQLYTSIEAGEPNLLLLETLKPDLINLVKTSHKSTQSRQLLEKGSVKFNGTEYELNDAFKIQAATLSDDLDVDEIIAAELLFYSEGSGSGLIDNAKALYYLRKQTILNIVSYAFNTNDKTLSEKIWSDKFVDDLLESFKFVHEELKSLHQLVDREKILGSYQGTSFQLKLTFRRDFLNKQHEVLGEIVFGLTSHNRMSRAQFMELFEFVGSFDVDDFFITHLLPGIFTFCTRLNQLSDSDVIQLHSDLIKDLKKPDIYRVPAKLISILLFLTHFINWCKESTERLEKFDFEIAIENPMTSAVRLGALEQLLIICAETSSNTCDLFYDMRALLEQHLPRLVPKLILDINEEETKKARSQDPQAAPVYTVRKTYKLSANLSALVTGVLHDFVQAFISDAAFLLIKIKDSQEDSLLSGEDFLLDDISKRADLERFYLSVFYLYAEHESLISTFWEDRESNAYGFIEWASKGEDLLMRSTFLVMLAGLSTGEENASHVYHFLANSDKISWAIIMNSLNSHIETIFKFESGGDDQFLNEETVLSVASYFNLIFKVSVHNEHVKELFDSSLLDILFKFIHLDTPLVGSALHVIRSLVSNSSERRNSIWEKLDSWLFHQEGTIDWCFQTKLLTFTDILGFVDLVESLLRPRPITGKLSLPYPENLGLPYRKAGITPYLEFLLSNVFFHSPSLYFSEKVALQEPILKIIDHALSSFDPKLILNSFPANVDLNSIVSTRDFSTYIQASSAPATLNFLFQEKIYTTLLDITSIGFDNISDKSFDEKEVQVVDLSLEIIQKILDLEFAYIDELLPILKKNNNFYLPSRIGTHGLSSFYDAVLFNLPVVAHIALYVGSSHLPIADKSIKLLSKFSKSSQFGSNGKGGVAKTKLLTIFDSINESLRIKYNFINQLEDEISSKEGIAIKVQALDFLNDNLSFSSTKITVSHFLLGFDSKNGLSLGDENQLTFIASNVSLFKSLLYVLESSLCAMDSISIDFPSIRLASQSLEIILKLARNPLSSSIILSHLKEYDFLNKLLSAPRINTTTLWSGERFSPNIDVKTNFNSGPSIGAFLSLLSFRSYALQFMSLELHRTSAEGSISKTCKYIDTLIDGYGAFTGPPKVLSFLDDFELSLDDVSTIPELHLKIFSKVDLNLDIAKVPLNIDSDTSVFDLKDVDTVLDLHLRALNIQGLYHTDNEVKAKEKEIEDFKNQLKRSDPKMSSSLVFVPTAIKSNEDEANAEKEWIRVRFSNYLSYAKFKNVQVASLHAWVQLIQVIVTDGQMEPIKRSNFVLEVFQSIIPRINKYVENDILCTEELVSLCVALYDIYHQDRKIADDGESSIVDGYERLYPLFKSAIHGILSPLSSLTLRSDLYVLANKYLSWVLKHEEISKEILQSIKVSQERLIAVICNDAISGEGPTRITGLLLLESLFQLSNVNQLNVVLNTLVKNNLLLLLVKSIKRTDETLSLSYDSKITLDTLLYELTAFKATLSFLVRVAETRHGAQQLLQSEVFQTIKSCQFLLIDPDLGIELVFDESTIQSSSFVRVNLNLDTPLSFDDSSKGVSLFEFLVPTFQLVTAILLSTSSENKSAILQVKTFLGHFKKLIVGVFKRAVLADSRRDGEIYKQDNANGAGIKELVNLLVLLTTLTDFDPRE